MKLLVVRLSAFGDILHCLPALEDLLARDAVELHWLVDARYRFVTELFPRTVIVHTVALKSGQPLREAIAAVHRLRDERFDAALDLQGLMKSALLARAIAPRVYGIDSRFIRERPASMLQQSVPFDPSERHVVQQYRKVAAAPFAESLESLGPMAYQCPRIRPEVVSALKPASPQAAIADGWGEFVVLHAAGGWETKRLPDATWIELARMIRTAGKQAVFSWGSEPERQTARMLAERSGALCLPQRLDMSALSHMLRQARAVVGADTGVLHLAAALGCTTVMFWGPSASWRSGPMGPRQWHIESNPSCGPCFKRRCDRFVCMEEVRASAIMEALHESGAV